MADEATPNTEPLTGDGDARFDVAQGTDPIALFGAWFEAAQAHGIELPNAVALATATPDAVPSLRMVLLKGFDADGFTFFTNYESRKARELEANPRAALCFHWKELDRQIRITGSVTRVTEEESRAYFDTRPEGSRIGAWASQQSRPLPSRDALDTQMREIRERFPDGDIPLPPFWGGYRLTPDRIEFWQGRASRLHDRIAFDRTSSGWETTRLYP